MTPGLHLLFPDSPGYARRWLSESRSANGPRFTWPNAAALDTVVSTMARPLPPGLDRKAALSAVPSRARAVLVTKEPFFLEAMRRGFPTLPGETTSTEWVTVLAEEWDGVPKGALLYVRESDQGRLAVIDTTKVVDPETGKITFISPPASDPVPLPSVHRLVLLDDSTVSILEAALGVLETALSLLGPEGMIAAEALGLLEAIFGVATKKQPVLPRDPEELKQETVVHDRIATQLSAISSYADWLSTQYGLAFGGKMPRDGEPEFRETTWRMLRYLDEALDPGSAFSLALADLKNGTYETKLGVPYPVLALSAFVYAASIHIMLMRADLMLSDEVRNRPPGAIFSSPRAQELVKAATQYRDHLDRLLPVIDRAFSERLRVSDVRQASYVETVETPQGGRNVVKNCVYVTDDGADKFPEHAVLSGSGGIQSVANNIVWYAICTSPSCSGSAGCSEGDISAGQSWRAQYIGMITQALAQRYNATEKRRAELHAVRQRLQEVIDAFSGPEREPSWEKAQRSVRQPLAHRVYHWARGLWARVVRRLRA